MVQIDRISVYFLMIRYPSLGNYIQESWNRGHDEELIDFLFALETDDMLYLN